MKLGNMMLLAASMYFFLSLARIRRQVARIQATDELKTTGSDFDGRFRRGFRLIRLPSSKVCLPYQAFD